MMKVINKPIKAKDEEDEKKEPQNQKKIDKASPAFNQANAILQQRKDENPTKKASDVKPTAVAGSGIVAGSKMQQYGESGQGG